MSNAIWYYKFGDKINGPLSAAELRQKAADGVVRPDILIRKGNDGHWVYAEKVRGLFRPVDSPSGAAVGNTEDEPVGLRRMKGSLLTGSLAAVSILAAVLFAGIMMLNSGAKEASMSKPTAQTAIPQGDEEGNDPIVQTETTSTDVTASSNENRWDEVDTVHTKPVAKQDNWWDQDPDAITLGAKGPVVSSVAVAEQQPQAVPSPQPAQGGGNWWDAYPDAFSAQKQGSAGVHPQQSNQRDQHPKAETPGPHYGNPKILTDSSVYEKTVSSVVVIRSFRGTTPIGLGSGFVLDPGDRIVTNEHVIRGASVVKIYTHKNKSFDVVRVIAVDKGRDIAVFPMPKVLAEMPGLRLAVVPPKVGDSVFALGAPKGLEFTFTKGIVSQLRRKFGPYGSVVQTDVSLSSGSSGSPLIDHYGQVVGINTLASSAIKEAHNLNFAVSAEEIATVCKNQKPCLLSELKGYMKVESDRKAAEEAKKKQREEEARRVYERRQEEERIAKAAVIKQWRGVRGGLTREQVRGLLGEPTRIEGGTTFEKWRYPGGGYVTFYNQAYYVPSDHFQRRRWEVSGWSEPD